MRKGEASQFKHSRPPSTLITCRLEQLKGEVRTALQSEFADARTSTQRLHTLLRTVSASEETNSRRQWDILRLAKAAMKIRLGLDAIDHIAIDTPHRQIASNLADVQSLIDSTEELTLSMEQTMIMQQIELARSNLLGVVGAVRDFVVRASAAATWHILSVGMSRQQAVLRVFWHVLAIECVVLSYCESLIHR